LRGGKVAYVDNRRSVTLVESIPQTASGKARWPLPHDTADVPGDHDTVLTEHAAATAAVICGWVDRLA
jgi:hypothetical protein